MKTSNEMLNLTDAEKLYHWRRAEKLTQRNLADRLKVHQTTISKMEKGTIPLSERAKALLTDLDLGIGTRVSILRRRLKMTLADVAAATGIHEHKLSEMERGLRDMDQKYSGFVRDRVTAKK